MATTGLAHFINVACIIWSKITYWARDVNSWDETVIILPINNTTSITVSHNLDTSSKSQKHLTSYHRLRTLPRVSFLTNDPLRWHLSHTTSSTDSIVTNLLSNFSTVRSSRYNKRNYLYTVRVLAAHKIETFRNQTVNSSLTELYICWWCGVVVSFVRLINKVHQPWTQLD